MTVTIISSLYGDKDYIEAPVPQTIPVDWVMVTDGMVPTPGWDAIVEPRDHMHPRLAAKVAKCRPDQYTDAEITIWVDASIIVRETFAAWCVESLSGKDLAQVPHPQRQSIVDEAAVSAGMEKYATQPVREQAAHYLARGFVDGRGMWATGIIVRRGTLSEFGDAWLAEQMRWSYQDQISQPYLLDLFGLRPVDLGGGLWHNPHFTVRSHRNDT